MLLLPPLESLRFFEAAARHQNFARAGAEIGVTPAAVAHRVRRLEKHLDIPLFDRLRRGVRLNHRGRTYLKEVQRILAEVHGVSERQRRWPRRVRIISVEAVAEKWLVPRLATFKAAHPGVAIEIETNHRGVDPDRRDDFDAWFAYTGETAAPRPVTRREDTLLEETLYEENLRPVCSPALLAARGRPGGPADLHADWPLLYDIGWDADWSYWFARQGQPTPDLSRASGFRLYSMLVQAAVHGLGIAVGRSVLIARELESRTLVPVFDRQAEAPERCCLMPCCSGPGSKACASSRPPPATRASPAPGPSSASPRPPSATASACWRNTLTSRCSTAPRRGVRLNRRGQAYLKEVQRILAEVHGVSRTPAPLAPPRPHRLGRGGHREIGSGRGSPRSRRLTPASPSRSKPTIAASTPTAATTSTPGSPTPARPPPRAR